MPGHKSLNLLLTELFTPIIVLHSSDPKPIILDTGTSKSVNDFMIQLNILLLVAPSLAPLGSSLLNTGINPKICSQPHLSQQLVSLCTHSGTWKCLLIRLQEYRICHVSKCLLILRYNTLPIHSYTHFGTWFFSFSSLWVLLNQENSL